MKENHDKLGANLNWSRMKLYNVIFVVILFMIAIVGVFFVIISLSEKV
jgi:5-bromo-4-chloroindolyl phosphate hydrolysis protein